MGVGGGGGRGSEGSEPLGELDRALLQVSWSTLIQAAKAAPGKERTCRLNEPMTQQSCHQLSAPEIYLFQQFWDIPILNGFILCGREHISNYKCWFWVCVSL